MNGWMTLNCYERSVFASEVDLESEYAFDIVGTLRMVSTKFDSVHSEVECSFVMNADVRWTYQFGKNSIIIDHRSHTKFTV